MKQDSLKDYLKSIRKFVFNYKKVHLIHFIVGMSLFLVTLIFFLSKPNDFGIHFISSFQQMGNFVDDSIFVVVSLLICYFMIIYFLIFGIISVTRKDKSKFWICDLILSFTAIITSIVFIHGTETLNILGIFGKSLSEFKDGEVFNGVRFLIIFFSTIFSVLMFFAYSLDRLIVRERKIKIYLCVKDYPFGVQFWKPDEANEAQQYNFTYHRVVNYVREMSNIKEINEEILNNEVHKLLFKANEQNIFYNPRFFINVKFGFKSFKKELILNTDFSFGVYNGYVYLKEIAKDILA